MKSIRNWFQAACVRYEWLKLLYAMVKRFNWVRVPEMAASLTYTTLLALVPLLTIVLVILSALPFFGNVSDAFMHFVHEVIVPQSAASISVYLDDFHQHAGKLTTISLVAMMLTSLMMVHTLDTVFNRIWQVRKQRSLWIRLPIYVLLLILAPVLIGVSITVSVYFLQLKLLHQVPIFEGSQKWAFSFIIDTLLFYFTFRLVPNCFVPFKIALLGALLTSLFLELTKTGFTWYMQHLSHFELVYGAFAVIPIFLLWIHALWLIVLSGAVFTACLSEWTLSHRV